MASWRDVLLGLVTASALVSTYVAVKSSRSTAPSVKEITGPDGRAVSDWAQVAVDGQELFGHGENLVIVFADFQCPYCKQFAEGTLRELAQATDLGARVVYRQYPLATHSLARHFAVGAVCAHAQARFVEYHDRTFAVQDSLGIVTRAQLAERSGVPDLAAFDECVSGDSANRVIDRGIAAGDALRVLGTPAVIVNGRMYFGTMSAVRLRKLIAERAE